MARILADLAKITARGFSVTAINLSLWDFSLRVYARPGIAPLCLELQDNYGADVNLLLWGLWLEDQQKQLTVSRLQQAEAQVASWVKETIQPLRQIRRQLKNQYGTTDSLIESLRQTIKQAELQAEQQEQFQLQTLAATWPLTTSALPSGENLRVYLEHLGLSSPEANRISMQFTMNKD
jgi:uncharacterized protein (TIGR02444 family)